MNLDEQLQQSLVKGFINQDKTSSNLDPRFLVNNPAKNQYFLTTLQNEVATCNSFFFSVAFITQSGLNAIKTQLADLNLKGIKGRILTSTYLGFNQPDVFVDLLKIPNLEVRVSNDEGFHSKGYLFQHQDYWSFIIGSANLTMNALKVNSEWNVYLTSKENGEVLTQVTDYLENQWKNAEPLTQNWIEKYRTIYEQVKVVSQRDLNRKATFNSSNKIMPNKMQEAALKNIKGMRNQGFRRALVISATGTGKTYLSAFDVRQANPKKMLFVVHREQILKSALESFKRVIGGPDEYFGILSGSHKDTDAKYLFATIQTISKESYLTEFAKTEFDYILIDEVHKAGADSYQKVIDYFEPKFLLGMTATPERTDDKNIFEIFDYHVAYEIRLQEAINEDLLAPFNYFGITEFVADGEVSDQTKDFSRFVSKERVQYILQKLNYYGCDKNEVKGLVFCGSKLEAKELARLFTEQNIASVALTGEDSISRREEVVHQLELGVIKYIFTVDIFNEGIDIPKVNQIVLLRNTQSSIVFIQQLGRGLRKDPDKEYVTIIDFIGAYQNNYLIPMALFGDESRNKDRIKELTFTSNLLTGLSSVSFEKIAQERIFKSIQVAKLDSMKELRLVYQQLKDRLNRVPYLTDFQEAKLIDPQLLATKSGSFDSYYSFLKKMNEAEGEISAEEESLLSFIGREMISGQRVHELVILGLLTKRESVTYDEIRQKLVELDLPSGDSWIDSALGVLDVSYYTGQLAKVYLDSALVEVKDNHILCTDNLRNAFENLYFVKLWTDLLTVGMHNGQKYEQSEMLNLYEKYQRRDVLRFLQWKKQEVAQKIGGYTYNKELKKFVIFITLERDAEFKDYLMSYEQQFLNDQRAIFYTRSPRKLTSPEVEVLKNPKEWNFYLFAKKSNDEGVDFYYLGEVTPDLNSIKEIQKENMKGVKQPVVSVELQLQNRIKPDLYKFLESNV